MELTILCYNSLFLYNIFCQLSSFPYMFISRECEISEVEVRREFPQHYCMNKLSNLTYKVQFL